MILPSAAPAHLTGAGAAFFLLIDERIKCSDSGVPLQVYDAWRETQEMTLCIGAFAMATSPSYSPCIILCTDYKVSAEEFSSETEYKLRVLSNQLVALVSGSPGRAQELSLMYWDFLKRTELRENTIVSQLYEPLTDFKSRIASRYIGRRLGISYGDLLDHGEKWFGKEQQQKYLNDIESNPLRVDMLIAGFVGKLPVLCEMRDGDLELRTNFCLIGTGAYAAEPSLHARNHVRNTLLGQALYNVYEAKKIGEVSPFVGKKTTIIVLYQATEDAEALRSDLLTTEGEQALENLFLAYGPKPTNRLMDLPEDSLTQLTLTGPL